MADSIINRWLAHKGAHLVNTLNHQQWRIVSTSLWFGKQTGLLSSLSLADREVPGDFSLQEYDKRTEAGICVS